MSCKCFTWATVAAAVLTLSSGLSAQLSGSVTIDASLPTGGGNYQTFQDCANDLQTLGVAGPLFVNVIPGPAPYAGFSLTSIPGASATNFVQILPIGGPGTVTISGAAAGFPQAVRLGTLGATTTSVGSGPSHLTLDGFEVTGAPSGAAILVVGGSFVTIRNCVAHTSGSGIGLTASEDCTIELCEVYGTTHLPGIGGSTSYSGGISAYYLSARNLINSNRIHDCADNGIFLGSSGSTTPTPDNIVVNNFIWNCGTQTSTTYAGGISCRRATNSIVVHNSIVMPAASVFPGISMMGGSSVTALMPMEVSNNIIRHEGSGPSIHTEYAGQFPATFDYNLYDRAGGGPLGRIATTATSITGLDYPDLPSWQGAATGYELFSLEGPASFLAPNDLHITPGSLAFNTGSPVTGIPIFDIDGDPRPLGGLSDIGADETFASGLLAAFSASATAGPAALTVSFTDFSFSSDPGGVTSWSWDFENDGTIDSTMQNPTHTYTCPGTYSVSLVVMDASNPMSTQVRTNYITVTDFAFDLATTGVGDLTITPIPTICGPAASAATGWTLFTAETNLPVSLGPVFGITPDFLTFSFLFAPATPGFLGHFTVSPGLYPNAGTVSFGAGSLSSLSGTSVDGVMVFLDPSGSFLYASNVSRVTF